MAAVASDGSAGQGSSADSAAAAAKKGAEAGADAQAEAEDVGAPSVPEAFAGDINRALKHFDAMINDDSMWGKPGSKKGVKMWSMVSGVGAKGQGVIPFPPQTVLKVLLLPLDDPVVACLDPDMKFGKELDMKEATGKEGGRHTNLSYLRYKGQWPVAERDMVCLSHWRVEPPGLPSSGGRTNDRAAGGRAIKFFATSVALPG